MSSLITPYFFTDKLRKLSRLYGIWTEYTDFQKKKKVATNEELMAILKSMGVKVENLKQVEIAILKYKLKNAKKHVESVYVFNETEKELQINVNTSEEDDWQNLTWNIIYENGNSFSHKLKREELKIQKEITINNKRYTTYKFLLSERVPLGYHKLEITTETFKCATKIIMTPKACYVPPCFENKSFEKEKNERKLWGISTQLYSLRSYWNWGIGDFSDLKKVIDIAATLGASLVGINPLHAISPYDIRGESPYYPTSRSTLEYLYIDLGITREYKDSPKIQEEILKEDFQKELKSLQCADLVDYKKVKNLKLKVLKLLFDVFKNNHLNKGTKREREFFNFCENNIGAFTFALFESLQDYMQNKKDNKEVNSDAKRDEEKENENTEKGNDNTENENTRKSSFGFLNWSKEYKNPYSKEVRDFIKTHNDEISFYLYIQFLAHEQLILASKEAKEKNLELGIYLDLALGARKDGAEAWANQDIIPQNINIGAPPDDFYNTEGQDWNVGCFDPNKLRDKAYEPYIHILQSQMKYADVLRIDHVMSLMRLYWIPKEMGAKNGVYVAYPLDDLMGIIALESHRNKCLIIGEDLGLVPDKIRKVMKEKFMLSYKVLIFEKNGDEECVDLKDYNENSKEEFKAPKDYEKNALVVTSVHDTPPLKGFWYAKDIETRIKIGHLNNKVADKFFMQRRKEREALSVALKKENIFLPEKYINGEFTKEVNIALHKFVAKTPCKVMLTTIDDLMASETQMNLPATYTEYPNWRSRLKIPLEEVFDKTNIVEIANAIKEENRG
ncbi:MAG: 4-alpha-glucanotransferase [Bdellovibrionota bacterium]